MNFDEIFRAYYTLYRSEAEAPNSEDDEYTVALAYANEAINRWANYDNTYWKELFVQLSDSDTQTIAADTTDYAAPSDMQEPGGYVSIKDAQGATLRRYPVVEPQEGQFRSDNSSYAFFTGNPNSGFTLHINPMPDSSIVDQTIDYVYYKKPTKMTKGSNKPDMSDPYFMVHRMLANRFRGSRNPYYGSAKSESENALKQMQLDNNSGSWANPWKLPDNSGTSWGV